ncbi:MAG: xanthine dehydrogenase family protein molybdopterin-binding subunit [Candidatus Saccharibacteria bacterium]
MPGIGLSAPRVESADKVTGTARYNSDFLVPRMLHARMLTSRYAHAYLKSIDLTRAWQVPGVRAIITGDDCQILCGTVLQDRPPIAHGKVRYYGEPVAVVVADAESQAQKAVALITVDYEPLPVINSPSEALVPGAPLIHENLEQYVHAVEDVYPEPNTNIAARIKIRKGDMAKGWIESEVVIESLYKLPQSDHIAMETRNTAVEILPSGEVNVHSSSQAPYSIRNLISRYFHIETGKINVHVPLVGGGFGGKAPVQLEIIAYLASKAVGGRLVKLANTREEDMVSSPCHLGLEATIKLGATRDGLIKAAEMTYVVDSGAYADTGPRMAKAMAIDCTGPYNIENVWCDSLCVYTNHPYVTSFRGFGHAEYTFCIERALDKLAFALGMDTLTLRMKNAITSGHTTPTQVKLTTSNLGNMGQVAGS